MDRGQLHETINQLVEAEYDQRAAQARLREFENSNDPPRAPGQFESLQDFLDFYGRQQDYENGIRDLKAERDNAMKQHEQARYALSRVLPTNVPLYYTYEGGHEALQGRQYVITNVFRPGSGQINISYTRPASS